MLQQTSIEAYLNDVKPKLNQKQQYVYMNIKIYGPVCNQELAKQTNQPINTITPRVLELRAKGKVEMAYKDIYPPTGRKVIYWRITDGAK